MFGVTTILCSIKLGTATRSSILETLPATIPLDITAGLTALQLCLTSAVSNNALYQHMEDCLNISRGINMSKERLFCLFIRTIIFLDFNAKRCVLRTILMVLAIVIAQSVPRFDLVMSMIGGTLTGPLVFILPPLFYVKILSLRTRHQEELAMEYFTNSTNFSRRRENKLKKDLYSSLTSIQVYSKGVFSKYFEKGLCFLIILFCTLATVITTYLNFSTAVFSYSNYTKPCIYNISTVLLYL